MEKQFHIGKNHPILQGHTVFGRPLMPGLAYIDLLFQFFRDRGYPYSELELRNLSIYRPLSIVAGREVPLRIQCTESEDGWRIEVSDLGGTSGSDTEELRYVTAEMRRRTAVSFDERLDFEAVRGSAEEIRTLGEVYERCRGRDLVHSGLMKAEGEILVGANATCFRVSLSPEALAGCERYMFHPALIDGVGIGSRVWIPEEKEGKDLFLPLSYGSFRACGLLQRGCLARIPSEAIRWKGDLFCLDIEFFDEAGAKVAELNDFTGKLAGEAGLIDPVRRNRSALADLPAIIPSGSLVEFLKSLVASLLDCPPEEIDQDNGYYDLGMDSVMLLEVVEALRERLSIDLAPTLLFEHTTIRDVADHLEKTHGASLQPAKPKGESDQIGLASAAPEPARRFALATARPVGYEDIAVIGLAGRYPGADTLDEFWANLLGGKDCVSEIPAERWDPAHLEGLRSPSGKPMSKWGGFIDRPDCFDPAFFKISPREAKSMDPQERLFLEVCWAAIEDAGYVPENVVPSEGRSGRRKAGVFAGVMHNDYALIGAEAVARGESFPLSLNYAPIANRVSYVCDFHGPSMAIDTVCSSSLTAIHLALESIQRGESRVALAGGVNLSLHPHKYLSYGMMDMHASEGRCRSFGRGGDGYVSSEGVGAVLLKPLRQALLDSDHIYAVIKGSVINHGGKVSGMSVPSPVAQADMIEECFERSGVDPRTISCIEAHGTGTSLGDPIEIEGLVRAFQRHSEDRGYCSIGSLKSNIGHAEAAAGVAGLSKLVLQLHHRTLVRSLHSEEVNPYLELETSPFRIQQRTEHWPSPDEASPRRGGLSSFGATGSNAHVIVEEFVDHEVISPNSFPGPYLVPLSARNRERLEIMAANLRRRVFDSPSIDLPGLAFTLQVGRRSLEERTIFLVTDREELLTKLDRFLADGKPPDHCWCGSGRPAEKSRTREAPADLEDAMRRWVANGEFERVAELWAGGGFVNWAGLYGETTPRRVRLPSYPFARERYWVPGGEGNVSDNTLPQEIEESVFYTAGWRRKAVAAGSETGESGERVSVFVASDDARILRSVGEFDFVDTVVPLAREADVAAQVEAQTLQLFRYAKNLILKKRAGSERLFVCVPGGDSDYPYRCLMGILRSLSLESPSLKTQLVFDAALGSGSIEPLRRHLRGELADPDPAAEVRYDSDEARTIFALDRVIPNPVASPKSGFKRDGVYWITGGLGGLGRLFAEHVVERQPGSRVILSGRSPLNSDKQKWLSGFADRDVSIEYHQCDTGKRDEVRELVGTILSRYGKLDGIIHGAGLIRDAYVVKKTEQEIKQVLAPKVRAALVLDESTRDLALDFFVLFSSVASFGSAGQLDYATGNAFLDAFAEHRNRLVARGTRTGKSLSINWPLWKEGGMSPGRVYEELLFKKSGMRPLSTRSGLEAFDVALGSSASQIGLAAGVVGKILDTLKIGESSEIPESGKAVVEASVSTGAEAREAVLDGISKVFSMEKPQIDLSVTFVDYGADSVMLTELANELNARFDQDFTGAAFLELDCGERVVAHIENQVGTGKPVEAGEDKKEELESIPAARMESPFSDSSEESMAIPNGLPRVAIVGLDGIFPDAASPEEFWDNIVAKRVSVRELNRNQWKQHGIELNGNGDALQRSMKWAALLEGVDEFDASFWGIEKEEAIQMDPQLRLLLASVWHCVENAGYAVESLANKCVGVFIAADSVDYLSVLKSQERTLNFESSLSLGMLANRLSYYCNFQGPSECIDTACSSVYVALNRAVQAIQCGQCELAVVGSAKVLLDPSGFEIRERGNLLSESGRTRSFDAAADGYVRGEGVGCLLLKPLKQAEQDRDRIHAVVAGINVSHNGREGLSSVAPNVEGQVRAMRSAYRMAGIDPGTVHYVEAHGTATELNDAAEMASYRKFFQKTLDPGAYREHRCAVSTVKPNIGHLEGASGIASLIKALLAIRHKKIPPTAAFANPHPSIFLENGPFYVPTAPEDWPDGGDSGHKFPRRVALHSVGLGGVNAHLILEEYLSKNRIPVSGRNREGEDYTLLVVSARSLNSLTHYFGQWLSFLRSAQNGSVNPECSLANIAYSSRVSRDAMPFRGAFVSKDAGTLISALQQAVDGVRRSRAESSYLIVSADGAAAAIDPTEDPLPVSGPADSLDHLSALADAWVNGKPVVLDGAVDEERLLRVSIPNYPFEPNKYWCHDEFETLFYETFNQ